MLLVQNQYGQNSRKNFDSEFQLKQNTSKQVFSEPREFWEAESGCEEEALTSGNDSEVDDNILYADPSDIPEEILETRGSVNPRKKNVRFGDPFNCVLDTSETSSLDNEFFGIDCGYLESGRKRALSQEPEINGHKAKDHLRGAHKTKWRPLDCGYDKTRPKSSPAGYLENLEKKQINLGEYDNHRMRRKELRFGRAHYGDFDDVAYRKPITRPYKFDCGDDVVPRWCDHCMEKKNYGKMKSVMSQGHKHISHGIKDSESEVKNHRKLRLDSYYDSQLGYHSGYCPEDYYDHGYSTKTKKKTLEAVQEQQEQFSDSTYKVPCTKFSSQTMPGELSVFPRKRSLEKLTNSSISDWMYYNGKGNGSMLAPPRIHKMRSRRTRMNKIKNGWKKAFVQTVRDGSRNERVGVIVMGSKGPEFYSKNSKTPAFVPFRKSKSFLDGAAKSFEVMTVDCKNVFLSSSEPGPRTNQTVNDLVCPEDDIKVEEKIAKFSKNLNDIVKHSEEKFYKALSTSEYPEKRIGTEGMYKGAGEGIQEEAKKGKREKYDKSDTKTDAFHYLQEKVSPRVIKSLRKPDRKISVDSKMMADALNEQARQYSENQSSVKEKKEVLLEELINMKEKCSPKEVSQEAIEANLSVWGMNLDQLSETKEPKEETKIGEKEKDKEEKVETSREKTERSMRYEDDVAESKQKIDSRQKNTNSKIISAGFRDLVENGCAISQQESENLQSIFSKLSYNPELCSNDVMSSVSSEGANTRRENKLNVSPRSPKTPTSLEEEKETEREEKENLQKKESEDGRKSRREDFEDLFEGVSKRKVVKMKNCLDEAVLAKKKERRREREGKTKKTALEDKMQLLRQALPSIAAENEAAHLKQLKKYIDRFIDRVEASTNSEFSKRKEFCLKSKESASTDSSEVRVDACKILDFVSNPFKKISSQVTINIAKKLTDTLVQDKGTRGTSAKGRKPLGEDTEDDGFSPCNASSGSERCEESEPSYLKELKKMRNEHLYNIVLEVKRLSELIRFLDRCNRLHF